MKPTAITSAVWMLYGRWRYPLIPTMDWASYVRSGGPALFMGKGK
jgi:hypothetical protein